MSHRRINIVEMLRDAKAFGEDHQYVAAVVTGVPDRAAGLIVEGGAAHAPECDAALILLRHTDQHESNLRADPTPGVGSMNLQTDSRSRMYGSASVADGREARSERASPALRRSP